MFGNMLKFTGSRGIRIHQPNYYGTVFLQAKFKISKSMMILYTTYIRLTELSCIKYSIKTFDIWIIKSLLAICVLYKKTKFTVSKAHVLIISNSQCNASSTLILYIVSQTCV